MVKKKNKKSLFRRVNDWLHLWLGITSGIVIFIVSITGCFYAFQQEILDEIETWRFVEKQEKNFVPPSVLLDTATHYVSSLQPTGLTYSHREGAAAVGFEYVKNGYNYFTVLFMNPYTGEFLKLISTEGNTEFNFFAFILHGHRALWLPYEIGRPIVGIATLVFIFLLGSGLIMWWPKRWNKSTRKKSFSIQWRTNWKRTNYDLHNVLGFYILLFGLILGITGLVWSFQWFDKGLYYIFSGGQEKQEHHHPHSDVTNKNAIWKENLSPLDKAWHLTLQKEQKIEGMYMTPILMDDDDPLEVLVYHDRGNFYNHTEYFYDRYTLEPLSQEGSSFKDASFADKLSHMNYDIHVGSVGGLAGKIFAFLISLVCASLPITGFLVWMNKKKN